MHLLALFALLWQLHTPLINICPAFGVPISGTGYDTATWTAAITPQIRARIAAARSLTEPQRTTPASPVSDPHMQMPS